MNAIALISACIALAQAPTVETPPLAIVGVTVIPMDRERVISDATVLVKDGVIAAVGPRADVRVPSDARRIDGAGRFVMPGLADMHVHTWDESELVLYLANGVTTVRNLFGDPLHLRWKRAIEAGELVGPAIVTSGPIIDGDPPVWPGSRVLVDPDDAERVVIEQKEAGYDCLKAYAMLAPRAYEALAAAADRHGMPLVGHVPSKVGLEAVLAARQSSIEHLDGWCAAAQSRDSPYFGRTDFMNEAYAWKHVDEKRAAELVAATVAARTWNCPTLVVLQKWVPPDEAAKLFARDEVRYLAPMTRASWQPEKSYLATLPKDYLEALRAAEPDRMRTVLALHRGGARLLIGTDTGNPFVAPGFAVHEELANFVRAGISIYETLRAATAGPAEFLHASGRFGTVVAGARADLLLVSANPLDDVANVQRRVGVIVRGRWLAEDDLRARLVALAAHNADVRPTSAK